MRVKATSATTHSGLIGEAPSCLVMGLFLFHRTQGTRQPLHNQAHRTNTVDSHARRTANTWGSWLGPCGLRGRLNNTKRTHVRIIAWVLMDLSGPAHATLSSDH